jgi:succinate dehydrogenase flavin-adding protein (antitoxin of CptAB toxin-antitoxin module)
MKELDILLERFVLEHETELSSGRWPEFERLLRAEDDVLWDWLQDPGRADAASFQPMLEAIRRSHA